MTTAGQFNTKSPTIKRILREAAELASSSSTDYTAAPLETDLFEWHFTIRGPPSTPYAKGLYHGRIVLPPSYPLRPPSFRFLTPSGRFEPNRELCLSISGHHEESWQPAWGVRTALVALRSFMAGDSKGQVGGVEASPALRERLADDSRAWRCSGCGRSCEEVMTEKEQEVEKEGKSDCTKEDDNVPAELRLGYKAVFTEETRDAFRTVAAKEKESAENNSRSRAPSTQTRSVPDSGHAITSGPSRAGSQAVPITAPTTGMPVHPTSSNGPSQQVLRQQRPREDVSGWLDMVIAGLMLALAYMVIRKLATWM